MTVKRHNRPFILFFISLIALFFATQASVAVCAIASAEDADPTDRPQTNNTEDGQWVEMGSGSTSGEGISNNSGHNYRPSLAISTDGMPIVAWTNRTNGDEEIYIRRWDGTAWVEMGSGSASGGGISNNSGGSGSPSLAFAPDGMPIVAWSDNSGGNSDIYIRRWDGTAWVEMSSGSASGGGISNNSGGSGSPSLACAPDGIPIVAWSDNSGGDSWNWDIYIRRWDGTSWVEMGSSSASGGGISNNRGESGGPSLAIAPDGMPMVAWYDGATGYDEIYVRRWNGTAWVEIGSGSASGGGISSLSGGSRYPSLAIGSIGSPIVAWEYAEVGPNSNKKEIYVRRWDRTIWEEMGSGSASGGGISNNSGDSKSPSLAISPDGTLIIAWYDDSGGDDEIYVRRWDGTSWNEMGSGSASGGGISNNNGDSFSPSLAISSDDSTIVAWPDGSDGELENVPSDIYVRRWQQAAVPPTADFSASPTSGVPSLIVEFTNLSTGAFDECLWDFGDGRTSTSCGNLSRRFGREGSYTISLTVKGPGGEDTKTVEDYIRVGDYRVFLPGVLLTK